MDPDVDRRWGQLVDGDADLGRYLGRGLKTPAGFAEIYGDYGEIAITNTGKSIATWGEGLSYTGPGGVWLNRQR